jgi:hypothetical protein
MEDENMSTAYSNRDSKTTVTFENIQPGKEVAPVTEVVVDFPLWLGDATCGCGYHDGCPG